MPSLKAGSTGPQVGSLQTKLKVLGFYQGPIDSDFGKGTTKALKQFQKSKDLKADGIAGPKTLAALDLATANKAGADVTTPSDDGLKLPLLSETDFEAAAKLLNCDVAAIKAVAAVESSGNGFLSDGRVKILFEGHQFYKFTKGAYAESCPTICYQKWTKAHYTKGANADVRGAGELARLEQAMGLDREAALKSASYGKFQIMGFNYPSCDFQNVEDFYAAMQKSEGDQLKAFCGFIKANGLDKHLRKHNWAEFARGYNGPEYWKNNYDQKLAAAHKKFSKG